MNSDPASQIGSPSSEVNSVGVPNSFSQWQKSIPLLIFVLALFVRLGYWADETRHVTHGFNDFHWLAGAPISDANGWIEFGSVVKRGCVVGHQWAARRPLYGYFLASLYVWTDAHLLAAQWANVVMSSLSVMFLYSITSRLFGVAAGLGAAVWFCFEPHSIHLSIIPLTETIGCFFTVWHLWWLIRATDGKQLGYVGAGFAFAAANLTRTLSLFALPVEVLLIWLTSARRRHSIVKGFTSAFLFGASVTVLLVIAMLRNYWLVGIFTISDNTSSILYSVTAPELGTWSSDVELEAQKKGLTTLKDRYEFYMSQAKENLKQHPWVYIGRVKRLAWGVISTSLDSPWFYWYQSLFAGTLIVSAIGMIRDDRFSRASLERWLLFFLVIACIVGWLFWGSDIRGRSMIWAMAALALGRSILRLDQGLFVANLWIWSVMGVAAFGVFSDRFMLMLDWLLAILAFGGISLLSSFIARCLLGKFPTNVVTPIDEGFSRFAHVGLIATSLVLLVSGYFGIASECTNPPAVENPKEEQAVQSIEATLSHIPNAPEPIENLLTIALSGRISDDSRSSNNVGLSQAFISQEQRQKGNLLIANVRRIGGPYRIPSDAAFDCFFDIARSRPYDRTINEVLGQSISRRTCQGWVTIDGDVTDEIFQDEFLIVAVYDHYDVKGFSDVFEALAAFPLRSDGSPDFEKGVFAHSPEHLKRIEDLITNSSTADDSKNPK